MVDVVLDEDAVLEYRNLHPIVSLAYRHHPFDGFASSEELGLGQNRCAAPTGFPPITAPLTLGLQSGRTLQTGGFTSAWFTYPDNGVRGIIGLGTGFLPAAAAATATTGRTGLLGIARIGVVGVGVRFLRLLRLRRRISIR